MTNPRNEFSSSDEISTSRGVNPLDALTPSELMDEVYGPQGWGVVAHFEGAFYTGGANITQVYTGEKAEEKAKRAAERMDIERGVMRMRNGDILSEHIFYTAEPVLRVDNVAELTVRSTYELIPIDETVQSPSHKATGN